MSSATSYPHSDSYRVSAAILTLLAHIIFFALLVLGISWQAEPPQGMVVDLWESLPDVGNAPSQSAPPVEKTEGVRTVQPPKAAELPAAEKAEIELSAKKKQPPPKAEKTQQKPSKAEKQAQAELEDVIRQQELAEQQAQDARARQAAALGRVMDEYVAKITAKIRRNVVLPPDVADDAKAEFNVTLLPGGEVLDVRLTARSGSQAYDSAVERAIWKASPLPVPSDPDLFSSKFRNLHLKFRPKDKE